mgnify:FL=1
MLSLVNSLTFHSGSTHEQMYSLDLDGVFDRLIIGNLGLI